MPLRVAEVNGWLKAVNKCRECPFMKRYPEKGMVCEHNAVRMTENEFKSLSAEDVIPVWCPLPRDEGDGKITVTGDKIEPLPKERSPSSLDREYF